MIEHEGPPTTPLVDNVDRFDLATAGRLLGLAYHDLFRLAGRGELPMYIGERVNKTPYVLRRDVDNLIRAVGSRPRARGWYAPPTPYRRA